jgi:hypothetical protein
MDKNAYLIVINESASGSYTYGIPTLENVPTVLYKSYLDAKRALMDIVATFEEFVPVAYGSAYPYENTTFEKEISTKDFALIGWVVVPVEDEEGDDLPTRVPVGLLKIPYSG